jgi:GH15 family glucan-1,4-alpha-glucosidase
MDPARLDRLAVRSLRIIRDGQDPSGAYLASPTFPTYRYSWYRDGAFIADAVSRYGDIASAEAFFTWCARVVEARRERIESLLARRLTGGAIGHHEFLPTRYRADGTESSEEWTDFQLDGYGAWLWALGEHCQRHGRQIGPWLAGAVLSARYVATFWDHPSYDWWEEHPDHSHTSTLAALYGGLTAMSTVDAVAAALRANFATVAGRIRDAVRADATSRGHLAKWLGGEAVDASLVAVATPFRLLEPDDPLMAATVRRIEADLLREGGVHRYAGDTYYGGGQWPLLAAFLGWHHAETGRIDDARAELAWVVRQATDGDELPEQVPIDLLAPERRPEWIQRWGPVACPLLWSHAMFLTLALALGLIASPLPSDRA